MKELGINTTNNTNSAYVSCTESSDDILKTHSNFVNSVGLEMSGEDKNLPYLYWTPKPHKTPFKHRFIAGSSKCTTKDLSCLLAKLLSTTDKVLCYKDQPQWGKQRVDPEKLHMPVVITRPILLLMKNTKQKAVTIASNSDSLMKSEVCNQSLVCSLIHEKPYWMSIQLHPCRHMTFPHCIPLSHTNC